MASPSGTSLYYDKPDRSTIQARMQDFSWGCKLPMMGPTMGGGRLWDPGAEPRGGPVGESPVSSNIFDIMVLFKDSEDPI